MKVLLILVAVLVIAGGLGAFLNAVQDFQTDRLEQEYFVQTTSENNTSVQLSTALWLNNIARAAASSNNTNDNPFITAYNADTRALSVYGLSTNGDRVLTVAYDTNGLAEYSGVEEGVQHFPLLIMVALIVIVLGAIAATVMGVLRRH